jgi:predicted ATPase
VTGSLPRYALPHQAALCDDQRSMSTTAARTSPRARPATHNLPAPVSSLVGRERELQSVVEAFRRARLVTLSGPGGVGKTRLALEIARRSASRRRHGAWLVDLAIGPATPDVAAETARVLGLQSPRGSTATDVLRQHLADRDLLLLLDNCEHVIDACAELVGALLVSCAGVRILATSREVLDVQGERVVRLEPFDRDHARRLFVERARQRRSEFRADERTEATIDRLCERVDRLPLAIELAAARVGAMSPEEILDRLESQLGTLGGRRAAPPRHRTVRATVGEYTLDVGTQKWDTTSCGTVGRLHRAGVGAAGEQGRSQPVRSVRAT